MTQWGCEAEQPSRFVERIRVVDGGKVKLTLSAAMGDTDVKPEFLPSGCRG